MQELWDFHRWLIGRVRADFPNLHIVASVTGEPSARAAGYILEHNLRQRYGDAAKRSLDALEMRRTLHEHDSIAHKLFHYIEPGGAPSVGVVEVNMHQAQAMHATDSPHHAKATLAHEVAHIIGGYKLPNHTPWRPLYEETAADLFEAAVMAVHGVTDHHDHLVFRRLRSRFNEAALALGHSYAYAAVAEEGRALARKYAGTDPTLFSPRQARREAEDIVWRNRERLAAWADFTHAAHRAGATHRRPGLAVLRELAPAHPIAQDMEALARFPEHTATLPDADRSLRMQRYEGEKQAIAASKVYPSFYIALDDRIIDGTWGRPKTAPRV